MNWMELFRSVTMGNLMSTLIIKRELYIEDLDKLLWGGARERWSAADDYTRNNVWETLICFFSGRDAIPDMATINDFIWYMCDDLWEDDCRDPW